MATISQLVKRYVDSRPTVHDSLVEGIVNYSALADRLHADLEKEMGSDVRKAAIIMALRRHAEKARKKAGVKKPVEVSPEIIIKTDLCDLCAVRTITALDRLRQLHSMVDYSRGDTFNIIQGNSEISVIVSQKFLPELKKRLDGEKILNIEKDLVSATLRLSRDFLYTPGIMAVATRKFAWENINIYEIISTMTEMIVIVSEPEAMRTYNALQELVADFSGNGGR
jgi:hypothetical protein